MKTLPILRYLPLAALVWLVWNCAGTLDGDRDSIPNQYDECPSSPEDFDKFEDRDGCPDTDNDQDGVPDDNDKCLNVPEDPDGHEDDDGCPDPDNDEDGIKDSDDQCPNEPEDFDGFKDKDGCPEPDNDGDGLLDDSDECHLDPEDMDGFEDEDGCPDEDNDKDGILDPDDKCPTQAETYNGQEDEDGCPDSGVPPVRDVEILPDLDWRTGTDEMTFESHQPLDSLALKLSEHPNDRVRILLFGRFVGGAERYLPLLAERQEALIRYLVNKGVKPGQLERVDYSMEAYEAIEGTLDDFNQDQSAEVHRVGGGGN